MGPPGTAAPRSCIAWAATAVLLAAAPACVKQTVKVRPASHAAWDPQLTPIPPFALAVPEDAIVRVVAPGTTCSGVLVEDDLVLTAHHCLVVRGPRGEFTRTEHAVGDVQIELGGDYLPWGTIGAKAIVAPPCGEGGGEGDIAVLVLDRKLVGVTPMPARLDRPPRAGEPVDPAGFGRCALSADGIRRAIRAGGPLLEVRPTTMFLTAAICPGDSGGPVFARGTRDVVGVVSTSAMDSDERTQGASVMTRVDTYRAVFNQARLIGDGLSKNELPPLTCGK